MKKLIYIFLLLCVTLVSVEALEFRFLGWPGRIEGLYCRSDGEMVPLSLKMEVATKYFEQSSGQDLVLYVKNENPVEGEHPYLPVASVLSANLPKTSCLVIVVKRENGSFSMVAIDDNMQDYPSGSLVLCSLVPYKIAMKVGDDIYTLAPLETRAAERQLGNSTIQVVGFRGDERRVRYNANILFRDKLRYFMFIQDSSVSQARSLSSGGGLEVFFHTDYIR
ncbi:hypothetical protein SH580_00205 [Coraliomargarita algicola]|uniref:Uncharacterized protein n=1 Tax=Coraliomargarita algicola TaxID=3092156 RepID=A0ABZ0RIT9_9BACT|nr:hypothetical protein [Coraliomargarita sp. J2-16]WPJ96120.1 hypothetical protein SH580_00205 [Coraliomargarita sp. J2-16]